jgi:hypothetical protein
VAADADGTVVIGLSSGSTLKFQVSADFGTSFSEAYTLAEGTLTIASINPVTGDLLLLYEASNQIHLTVYGIDGIRDAAPARGGLEPGGDDGGDGGDDGDDDQAPATPDATTSIATAVAQAASLTPLQSLLVRGGEVVMLRTTIDPDAGSGGAMILEDEDGTLAVTVSTDGDISLEAGLTVAGDGEIFCEICALLAAGTDVEAWIYSEPRLGASTRVEVEITDLSDAVCPLLRITLAAPLDGGDPIEPGRHTLQLRMTTANGPEILAVPITVGAAGPADTSGENAAGGVPAGIPAGGGPMPLVPLTFLLALMVAAAAVLLAERTRETAWVVALVTAQRRPAGRHLSSFDALEVRLDELRRSLRNG